MLLISKITDISPVGVCKKKEKILIKLNILSVTGLLLHFKFKDKGKWIFVNVDVNKRSVAKAIGF